MTARWWHTVEDGRIQCDVCPRECRLRDGQRGFCFVRAREGDEIVLTTYGRSSGFCIDPIEKKPLAHFHPGTSVLSFGTAGCNLGCKFCQNWDMSKARELDRLMDQASPEVIAQAAVDHGCRSVAFTYNDPVIFAEYAIDTAIACRERGVSSVAVTAGYVNPETRRDFFSVMDAANVDLKGFTDAFYEKITGAKLQPVLDTLSYLVHETDVWVEITTLLIPGYNDSDAELHAMGQWVMSELGPDVPHHVTAFHPDWRMRDVPPTPPATLLRAREVLLGEGLRYVYTGNISHRLGEVTYCATCDLALIERDRYELLSYRVTPDGCCPDCGTRLPGRYDAAPGDFGPRRIPVRLGTREVHESSSRKERSMVSIDSAENFVWLNARLLERLRFDHLFRGGDPRRVVDALRPYRNGDGGFGHGLEPDLRGPDSQPVPVDIALSVLHEAGDHDSDMLMGILDWLRDISGPDGGVPFVLPSVTAYPRGPWWQPSPGNPGALNPTAALVASLYRLGVRHPWVEAATQFCWDQIDGLTETSPYEMRAILAFLEEVPDRARVDDVWKRISPLMLPHIAMEPGAQGDVHPPLAFAPRPDSLARSLFSDALIAAHLDALEAAQQPDGGWGFGFPSWTPITTPEWRGWVTIESLVILRDNGRL